MVEQEKKTNLRWGDSVKRDTRKARVNSRVQENGRRSREMVRAEQTVTCPYPQGIKGKNDTLEFPLH